MLWETSDLQRPLSPTRRSKHSFGQLQCQVDNRAEPKRADSPDRPIRQRLVQHKKPVASQQPLRQHAPSNGTPTVTLHYLGLAQGELGVLSKRQVLPRRPATAPAQEKEADSQTSGPPLGTAKTGNILSKSCQTAPWRPLYSLDQQHQAQTTGSSPARDIRLVVDDPDGRRHALHDVFTGKPLQPMRPCSVTTSCSPKRPSTTRVHAAMSGYGMPVHARPRLLSAGGFPGWKLSKTNNPTTHGHAPDPRVPRAFSQITCPSTTCHGVLPHSTNSTSQSCPQTLQPTVLIDITDCERVTNAAMDSQTTALPAMATTDQLSGGQDGHQTHVGIPEDATSTALRSTATDQQAASQEAQEGLHAKELHVDETRQTQEFEIQGGESENEAFNENVGSFVDDSPDKETDVDVDAEIAVPIDIPEGCE